MEARLLLLPAKEASEAAVFAVKNFKWPRAFEGECRGNKTQDYLCQRNTPAFHTLLRAFA